MTRHPIKLVGTAIVTVATLSLVSSAAAQCGSKSASTTGYGQSHDIVATAKSAGTFNTLLAAAKAAGLVDALRGDGPLTVFAPTDDAFAKLPEGTVETLLKPENRSQLQGILKYHVVPGKLMAREVTRNSGATTLNGQRLDFKAADGKVMVDSARVVKADIKASNGVIHVIDNVMLPTSDNVVTTAQKAKSFQTLLTAATKAGLADTLSNGGPYTVFAPTDEAFAKLPDGTLSSLLKPENRDQLAAILRYHVVEGRVYSTDALAAGKANTLCGNELRIASRNGTVRVNDARILATDVDASNGVIHVIDSVMLPQ